MIKVLYFSSLRETVGVSEEEISTDDLHDINELKQHLASRGGKWQALFTQSHFHTAVNQEVVRGDVAISDGDEIAFFPEVTGG